MPAFMWQNETKGSQERKKSSNPRKRKNCQIDNR